MVHVQMHGITMMHVQNMVLPCYMSKTKTRLYHDACTKHGMTMVHLQKIGYYHGTSKMVCLKKYIHRKLIKYYHGT